MKTIFVTGPNYIINGYVLKTGLRRSLLLSCENLHLHLYFIRTIMSNYQGATADVVEILANHKIDVREFNAASMGNVTLWNACVSFPKGANIYRLREELASDLTACGMLPPISFFLIERFPFLGNIEDERFEVQIDESYDVALHEETISNLNISWNPETPSAVISTKLDLIPGVLFYFIPPKKTLVRCEVIMKDRAGEPSSNIQEISKIVSRHIDLVGSNGLTVRYGEKAMWRFYGIITGDTKQLKKEIKQSKAFIKFRSFGIINPDEIRISK